MGFSKRTILFSEPVSGSPELNVVLAHTDDPVTPYVVWLHDRKRNEFFWGHYCASLEAALEDYRFRLALYG